MTPHALPDASKQPVIAPSVQRAIDATENAPPVHLGVLNPTNDADQPYQPHQQTGGAAEPDGIHTSHLIGEECATGGEVRRNGTGWECTTLDTSATAPGSISNSDGDQPYGFHPETGDAARPPVGFAEGIGQSALTPGRLQHGTKNLTKAGVLPPWSGTNSRGIIERAFVPILEHPRATFDHSLGGTGVRGFLGDVNGQQVAVFVYKEGPYQGQLASSFVPSDTQLRKWGIP